VTDASRYSFIPGPGGPTIVGGQGAWLHTADGRRILDGAGGAIVANVGYGRREVAAAVHDVMATGAYVHPLWPTPSRLALVDRLRARWLPEHLSHVFFTSGGSESADSAIRLARAYHLGAGRPERWKIVGRDPSYHGITLGAIAAGAHDRRRAGFEPLLLDFPKIPWDDIDAAEKIIEAEDPATIAGLVFEPLTGAAGACLEASHEYWQRLADLCRHHDILLIADEVMTGFGRTGRRWGHEHLLVRPDVIYGGKGLGGGYVPIGMVAASDAVVDALRHAPFMFFTFTGADAMCAAADAVLRILDDEHLVERSAALGERLGEMLADRLGGHRHVGALRGRGLFRGIELVADRATGRPFPLERRVSWRVVSECLARDVAVYPAGSGPVQDAVMLGPPFVIEASELQLLVDALAIGIDAATA
jgi:adenosylmethionine-8-amino-7-oxononanoate aminotransferase